MPLSLLGRNRDTPPSIEEDVPWKLAPGVGAPKELGAVGGGFLDWKLRRADILVKDGPLRLIAGDDATAETEDMVGGAFDGRGRERKGGVDASCSRLCVGCSC